jgi:hypothetical protein
MTAITLGIPEHQVRVVAPRSAAASARSSTSTPRSCSAWRCRASTACRCGGTRSAPRTRWPRSTAAAQIQHIELAADADGKLTAVRVRLLADMGAYLQLVTPGIPAARRLPVRRRVRAAQGVRLLVHRGVHHDDPDRRLPGRRPTRGHVRHRAGDGRLAARWASTRSSCAAATSSPPRPTRTRRSAG